MEDYYTNSLETSVKLVKTLLNYLAFKNFDSEPFKTKKVLQDTCASYNFPGYAATYAGLRFGMLERPK